MVHQASRILFGSCSSQHLKQPLWPAIIERDAQAFVWAGDAVYGDEFKGRHVVEATPTKLAADYEWMLESNAGYKQLMDTNVTIIGTWDDHDFGINNGDGTYQHKRENAQRYVDFLEKSNHGRTTLSLLKQRADNGDGVYGVFVFEFERDEPLLSDEEAGIDATIQTNDLAKPLSNKSVAVFLVDVRSHKTPWNSNGTNTDNQGDFLGDKQWTWLEKSLSRSTAAVNILVSGLQVHTDRFISGRIAEEWSRFPLSQHRLYQALLQPNVKTPLIVSGDVHMGEFLRRDCQRLAALEDPKQRVPRSIIEVTTSGMTHSWGTYFCSRPEQWNPVCRHWYFQRVLTVAMHWAHQNFAWKELVRDKAWQSPQYTLELNFAEFEFDWEERTVTTKLLGIDGIQWQTRTWKTKTLSGEAQLEPYMLTEDDYSEAARVMMKQHGVSTTSDYYCLPYRGPQTWEQKYFGFLSSFTLIGIGALAPFLLPLVMVWYFTRPRRCKNKTE